ncbi:MULTISPECIES: SAM-dependent methyltransferase [unclassified Sinorhizobium]|uniref:SAM-dependent methyltransferase n=1 Tax=unclassified Sinorhizobium TaxID=2613772 RepID=UPI003525A4A3
MTSTGSSMTPAPMEGNGAYNRNSYVQQAGFSPAVPLFERAARLAILPPPREAIVIADYGSSQGHNSFGPIGLAIRALRERMEPDQAISVVHTDVPDSDFSALFQAIATDPQSYLHLDQSVFASAVGRTFYEQILPSGSVTLGWCSWAVQWLSHAPAPIPDQVQVAYSKDKAVREQYARQAAEDWRTFLQHRALELRPGGRLVVLTMALTQDGDFGYQPVLEAMYAALLQLIDEGFLSEAEVHRMAIPTVARGLSDLKEPFSGGRFADLAIDHAEVFLGQDPIWNDFERDGDAKAYGARWAAFSRASVLPTLALSLEGGATDPRVAGFLDSVEAGMSTRLAASPLKFAIPLGVVALRKE